MRLDLYRRTLTENATLGDLFVDGFFQCYTLEDPVRDLGPDGLGKVPGATAIPAGEYTVIVNHSPKFGRLYPRLLNVPYFDGILIHRGNRSEDTRGCILVGQEISGETLVRSTQAFDILFKKLKTTYDLAEPITIRVSDNFAGEAL